MGGEYLLLLQIILKRKTNNTDKELITKFEQECTDEFNLKKFVLNYFIIWMKHFGYLLIWLIKLLDIHDQNLLKFIVMEMIKPVLLQYFVFLQVVHFLIL